MVEPEPEIWVRIQQTKFVEQGSCTNNTIVFFSFQWTKLFWSRSQQLLDVGVEAKIFRCPEPEIEIWVCSTALVIVSGVLDPICNCWKSVMTCWSFSG